MGPGPPADLASPSPAPRRDVRLLEALARSGTRAQVVDRLLDEHGGVEIDHGLGRPPTNAETER